MKYILVLASFGMLVHAEGPQLDHAFGGYGSPGYGPPAHGHGYGGPGPAFGGGGHHAGGGLAPSIGAPILGHHQAPIIHKHVYVHVPPPEPYFPRIKKVHAPLPPPQKHYKIIFIKAPTPPPVELPDVPLIPPAPEVKTLVYVLTKRPEPLPELNIPVPPPPAQHKPEVFFIRYKTPGGLGDAALDAGGLGGPIGQFAGNRGQEAGFGGAGFDDGQGHAGGHGGENYH